MVGYKRQEGWQKLVNSVRVVEALETNEYPNSKEGMEVMICEEMSTGVIPTGNKCRCEAYARQQKGEVRLEGNSERQKVRHVQAMW